MNQFQELKQALQRQYDIDIDVFLDTYTSGMKQQEMLEVFNTSPWKLRTAATALNLRFAKKYRTHDFSLMVSRDTMQEGTTMLLEANEALDDMSKDLVSKERQLKRARQEVSKYRRSLGQPLDIEELVDCISKPLELPKVVRVGTENERYRLHTQFIVLSDLHFEEAVVTEDVGLANKYNWEVAESRLQYVIDEAIGANRGERKCILMILGDTISGIIHDTLENTTKPTGQAIADLAKLLAKHINVLATLYEELEVMCVTGNHGRMSEQRKSTANGFNFEYLLFEIMLGFVTAQNVRVNFSTNGYATTKVADKVILGHHGDFHRAGTGVTRALKVSEACRQATGLVPHHIFQGHTHTPQIETIPSGGQYITNGSLIGANGYSHTNGFIGLSWAQTIGCFDSVGNIEYSRFVSL
jgi:predicted MPP superfamily phosphohydrolase